MPFFPRQIRTGDQHLGLVILGPQFRDGLLPAGEGPDAGPHELEYRHFRGRAGAELGLLFGDGEAQVCGTGEVGQESRLDGVCVRLASGCLSAG